MSAGLVESATPYSATAVPTGRVVQCNGVQTTGVVTTGSVYSGPGFFKPTLILEGAKHPTAQPVAANMLLLDGAQLSINASTITAPQTAAARASLFVDGTTATPQIEVALQSFSPSLVGVGTVFTGYATTANVAANSLIVCRTLSSRPVSEPVGSYNDDHLQALAADLIPCPTITAQSRVKCWLAGLTGVVGATAVLPATATLFVPGTGFTLNGTVGARYGYEVLYG